MWIEKEPLERMQAEKSPFFISLVDTDILIAVLGAKEEKANASKRRPIPRAKKGPNASVARLAIWIANLNSMKERQLVI